MKNDIPSMIGRNPMLCRVVGRRSIGRIHKEKQNKITKNLYAKSPVFSTKLRNDIRNNTKQLALINYFEKGYEITSETPIVKLYQNNFAKGTVRITKPGVYVLQENISFNPNPTDDSMPTANQNSDYPTSITVNTGNGGTKTIVGAYRLGFFAAITVECDNVIINLNGKTLKQSKLHFLQQRFYANIELASAPFIGPQGPGMPLGEHSYKSANNVCVMNGTLGLSSHHGIHSNFNKGVVVKDVVVKDFQVAGIALNGLEDAVLDNVEVGPTATNIPVSFAYSQGRFIRSFLGKTGVKNKTLTIHNNPNSKTGTEILGTLNTQLDAIKTWYVDNNGTGAKPSPTIFSNENTTEGLSDGNVYGIVFNVTGVVVNEFLETRPADGTIFATNTEKTNGKETRNKNIHLHNINIHDIKSKPRETIVLSVDNSGNNTTEGYTNNANLITGPVGDVFDIDFVKNISNSNKYKENPLSNAQALLGKLASGIVLPQGQGQKHVVSQNDKISGLGTSYTHPYIIDWIKDGNTFNLSNVTPSISEKENLDGMAHFMKGNIGLFLSGSMGITGSAKITGVSADGAVFRQIPDATGSKAHNNLYKATSNINLTLN